MTNENAIKWLKDILKNGDFSMPQYEQALEMAIKALEHHDEFMKRSYEQGKVDALSQEPCDECRNKRTSFCGNCKEYDEFEPCDDAISRKSILKYIDDWWSDSRDDIEDLIIYITYLPSVTQKSETETWNGIHGQITAPKGTFKKIFDDAESEDKE